MPYVKVKWYDMINQRVHGLVLCGGSHIFFDSEICKEFTDIGFTHVIRMSLFMKKDKSPDPVHIGLLGSIAEMPDRTASRT